MEGTVIMSLEEYELMQNEIEEAKRIKAECEKSSEERGYLVKNRYILTGYSELVSSIGFKHDCAEVEIMSANEVVDHLVKQVAKWKDAFDEAGKENKELEQKIRDIYHRNLWQRIINEGAPLPGYPR